MNGLDLFSGIGGLSIALTQWVRPVAYCEIDPYCQGVLMSRMADESIPCAPVWDDITTLSGLPFQGAIDIIYGGFPCQDISICGRGEGLGGKRSGLFFEIVRLCREIKPRFIFIENVPTICSRGGGDVVKEITEMGYDSRWCVISAASVGAPHKRERWFLLAHSPRERLQEARQPRGSKKKLSISHNKDQYDLWNEEPKDKFELVRVDDGLRDRAHRIKALGNAVVPLQAKKAFKILMGY